MGANSRSPKLVAFLRAINVGGHKVKMDQLRKLFEALELMSVETFIASGNVVFDASAKDAGASAEDVGRLERRIEDHLLQHLGYKVATFIRSTLELAEVAAYRPFAASELEAEGNTLHVGFLPEEPDAEAQQRLMALRGPEDEFHVHGREAYWLCRIRTSDSRFSGAVLEKTLGMPATLRNLNTVKRLVAKYPAG